MIQGRIVFTYAGRTIVAELTSTEGWIVTEDIRNGAIANLLNLRFSPSLYRPSAGDPIRCAIRDAASLVHGRYEFTTHGSIGSPRSTVNNGGLMMIASQTL